MVFYKILVHGKDIISILFVIVILIGTLVVSPTLTSIYGSASASFANTSSQKKTEEPATFTISDMLKETIKSTVEKKTKLMQQLL